jgi:hypothetical protein
MLKVFRRSGLPMDQRAEGNTVHIVLQLDSAGPETRPPERDSGDQRT